MKNFHRTTHTETQSEAVPSAVQLEFAYLKLIDKGLIPAVPTILVDSFYSFYVYDLVI